MGPVSLRGGDGERLCRPGHQNNHDAGIGYSLGTNLCHGFMDLYIALVIERDRNVHIHSAFVTRPYNGSVGEVRIEPFHGLKIPSDRQLGRERQSIKIRSVWTGKRFWIHRLPPVDSSVASISSTSFLALSSVRWAILSLIETVL